MGTIEVQSQKFEKSEKIDFFLIIFLLFFFRYFGHYWSPVE